MSISDFSISVSAPGSVMLMGEHAVVKGFKAIACAVDKRINVILTARNDRNITIDSSLGQYSSSLDSLCSDTNLSFVLKAIEHHKEKIVHGFDLKITAEFSHTLGLGSSAAVTVATIKALAIYTNQHLTKEQHLQKSIAVVHAIQGRGSGTDLAASIYGGVIAYQIPTNDETIKETVENLPILPSISLYYAGYKTKTATVLSLVAEKETEHPALYQQIYQLMGNITTEAIKAARRSSWAQLGILMNMYQGQMDSLGVNDAALSDMIYQLRNEKGILGSKISGSGLGDCMITLGEAEKSLEGYQKISTPITSKGVMVHGS